MLDDVQQLISDVSSTLDIDQQTLEKLLKADAEHIFEINLDNGKSFKAFRIQHNNKNGPYKGGLRFHENVSLDEVRALATLMSLKTAAAGLPLGGGKGGVAVNPKNLSKDELEELSRKFVKHLHNHIGPDKDVPAPDVNTNATVIDWMLDEYEKLSGDSSHASFTGKSIEKGGSLGRTAATGRGGVIALRELLELLGENDKQITFAVQGYGNVGQYFARVAQNDQKNWKFLAVSDSSACLYSESGLDARELARHKEQGGRFSDFDKSPVKKSKPEEIVGQEVDVLVLAALEDAVNDKNASHVKAKYIVEMANGPVTSSAHDYLTSKGIIVVPDIIANAGGVIVSYLEWKQNKDGEKWSENKVNVELEKYMARAVKQMYETSIDKNVSLKEAAFMIALKNLL